MNVYLQLSLLVHLMHADTEVSLKRCPYKPDLGRLTPKAQPQHPFLCMSWCCTVMACVCLGYICMQAHVAVQPGQLPVPSWAQAGNEAAARCSW